MTRYPFSPEVLDALPEELAELYRGLEITLLEKIANRVKANMPLGETTLQEIRALRSHGISFDEVRKAVQEKTGVSDKKLNALFADVVNRNKAYYTEVIDLAKLTQPDVLVNALTVDAIRRQTVDEIKNISRSMAFYVNGKAIQPAKAYQWAVDSAIIQVHSGAVSYGQAIANATRQLADSGLQTVDYESGRTESVDVAVRRAVLTGVSQVNEQYNTQSLEYLQTDLVEVSAHAGARNTGVGFENHESWQGKIYRWEKYTKMFPDASKGKYKDFEKTCGLGDVQGIHGSNCRHWYSPFVEGVMEPTYTDEQLNELKAKDFVYEGKAYDTYTATQKQREIERAIRRQKRRLAAAVNNKDATAIKAKIRILNGKYKEFSEAAGLRMQKDRTNVYLS